MKARDIEDKLKNKKLRPTAMRELVLKIMLEESAAMSLADLEGRLDYADRSTIFRTLKTFEEKKIVHCIDDGSGSLKYAVCHDSCDVQHEDIHIHFLCSSCEQTYCLNDIDVPAVNLPHGFELNEVNVIVKGTCLACSSLS